MKFLIISDLHIGIKARSKELCPYPDGSYKDDQLVDSFLTYASNYIKNFGDFDFLIIPGDITNNSNLIEYDCGSKFLTKITKELNIDISKVIFVPGNHDVDWSILTGIPEEEKEFRRPHKYNTLKDISHVFSNFCVPDLLLAPYLKVWEFDDVVFFGFNSSWHDDAFQKNHYGLITLEQIQQLKEVFDKTDMNKLKIFVVHHHLHQFDNPHPDWIDVSIMQNGQSLINLLSEYSFNFVLHGHRHLPNFLSTQIENFNPINILCSGSYSCEVPTEIAGYVGNLFHVLEIDSFTKDNCKGRVLSLAYDHRKGWIESADNHGIGHISPFGNEMALNRLIDDCSNHITEILKKEPMVSYSQLVGKISDLAYLPAHSKDKLLKELKSKCNVSIAKTEDDLLFILKKP